MPLATLYQTKGAEKLKKYGMAGQKVLISIGMV
jgi:hypothetical protein